MGWVDLWNLPENMDDTTHVGTWVNQVRSAWTEGYEHGQAGDPNPTSCGVMLDLLTSDEKETASDSINPGDLVIYKKRGCNSFEIGRALKRNNTNDGWFIFYSRGETAANTPDDCIFPIDNKYSFTVDTDFGGQRAKNELNK